MGGWDNVMRGEDERREERREERRWRDGMLGWGVSDHTVRATWVVDERVRLHERRDESRGENHGRRWDAKMLSIGRPVPGWQVCH
jgi:hypothetical protein